MPGYAQIIVKKIKEGFFFNVTTIEPHVINCDIDIANLSDDKLVLCPPTVLGFSLKNKFWDKYTRLTV